MKNNVEIFGTRVINGFEHKFGICNFDFLLCLKKHPRNRACGDDELDADGNYLPGEISKAKTDLKKLLNRIEQSGFDAGVKMFVVAIINDEYYIFDGQHNIAVLKIINKKNIDEYGKLKYNEFKCEIIDFKDDVLSFLRMLEKFNNGQSKYTPTDTVIVSEDPRTREWQIEIVKNLGISESSAVTLMFGNLSTQTYKPKLLDNTRKNFDLSYEFLKKYLDQLDMKPENKRITNFIRKKNDMLIILQQLLFAIYGDKFKKLKEDGFTEKDAIERVKSLGDTLLKHMLNIDIQIWTDMINDYKTKTTRRKTWLKPKFEQMLLGTRLRGISENYKESIRSIRKSELKDIILDWSETGKNGNNGINSAEQ